MKLDFGLGDVINGMFDLADTAITAHYDRKAMDKQYQINSNLQEDNQAFQREMRDTQYQATVADMEKAGINPAVALSGGAALSSAQGGSSASVGLANSKASNVAATMMQSKAMNAQINNQTALTEADVELKRAQATKEMKDAGFTDKQIEYYMKHGVFPGATISGGAFGANASIPVGLKTKDKTPKNTAKRKRDFEDMSKFL